LVTVDINLLYKNTRHKAKAYGIKTEHIDYPVEAWRGYMYGQPYDWDADDHIDHSPEGYRKFVRKAKRLQKRYECEIDGSYKLGDVVWSCKRKRWYLVDID
jgi:hypothetical protein